MAEEKKLKLEPIDNDDDLTHIAGGSVESFSGVCKTCMAITVWVRNFWGTGYECSQCHQNNPGTFYDLQGK